jgi:PAS domain S-box-containing protein
MAIDAGQILSGGSFMPSGMWHPWRPGGFAQSGVADLLITIACFSVPLVLLYFTGRRRNLRLLAAPGGPRAQPDKELSRGRLAAIVESSDDAIISKTPDGTITSWNRGAERIFGYSETEAIGRPTSMLFPTDRAGEEIDILARVGRGEHISSFETVRVRKDGQSIDISATISPIVDGNGNIIGASKIARDITERRRAQGKLEAQFARHRLLNVITRAIGERQDLPSIFQVVIGTLEDQLPADFACMCVYHPPGILVIAVVGGKSHELAASLGLTEKMDLDIDPDGLSRCVRGELAYEPDLPAVPLPLARRFAAAGLCAMVAAPLLVDGKVFGLLIVARYAARSFSNDECEFLGQLSDHVALAAHQAKLNRALQVAYEELRQTQQAVMSQEKLRVLGQMASGIAHDINNVLSPAALYVESLIERESGKTGDTKEYLLIIQRAIEGVAQTVARMKEFYSQRDPQLAHIPVNLNRTIDEVVDLARARWTEMLQESGRLIRVETDLAPGLPAISGNESEIRDALTNLVLNAADAMPGGGLLTLRSCALGADRVQVDVTDTGMGMDEATRSRCLELFFTTKGARGTGLGLAMVYGTIERHGAELEIESAPGAGTHIRLIFPALASGADSVGDTPPRSRPRLPLRILAIDDDPVILKSLLDTLEGDGHFVEIADGGQRGIDAFRAADERGEVFAVVITDLGMPQVDGRTVATAVKAIRPGTPVILLTGWGQRLMAEHGTPEHVDLVLGKPPKLGSLRSALAELTGPAHA